MKMISEKIQKRLEEMNVENYKYVPKSQFTTVIFSVKDPISKKILVEYVYNEQEFKNMSFKEKAPFKSLPKTLEFNEKAYLDECKRQEKIKEIYELKYKEVESEILKEENISKNAQKRVDGLMEIFSDYVDLNDINVDDLEYDLLYFVKGN